MIEKLTNEQIQSRLDIVEQWIAECKDEKSLPALNAIFQRLIEEQVRRDMGKGKIIAVWHDVWQSQHDGKVSEMEYAGYRCHIDIGSYGQLRLFGWFIGDKDGKLFKYGEMKKTLEECKEDCEKELAAILLDFRRP